MSQSILRFTLKSTVGLALLAIATAGLQPVHASGYNAIAVADSGTDGLLNILWSGTNSAVVSTCNNSTGSVLANHYFSASAGWTVQDVSEAPNNVVHVLWSSSNGSAALYNLNSGGALQSSVNYGPYPGWTAKRISTDINGRSRILWTATDNTISVWWIDAAGNYLQNYIYGPYVNWYATDIAADSVSDPTDTRITWACTDHSNCMWGIADNGNINSRPIYNPITVGGGSSYAASVSIGAGRSGHNWPRILFIGGGDGNTYSTDGYGILLYGSGDRSAYSTYAVDFVTNRNGIQDDLFMGDFPPYVDAHIEKFDQYDTDLGGYWVHQPS